MLCFCVFLKEMQNSGMSSLSLEGSSASSQRLALKRQGGRGQNKHVPFHEIGLKFDGHEIRRRRRRRVIPSSTTTWCLMGWGHVCCTRAPLTVSPCVFTRAPTAHLSPALDATLPPPRLRPRPWPSFCSHPRLRLTRTSSDNRKQSTNHHPVLLTTSYKWVNGR